MLCQNCNKNEANMHMKRIVNGRAAEVHLCSDCARSLGYGEAFSGMGLGLSDFLGDLLLKGESSSASLRCPGCKKSFDEIAEDGKIGCAECYATFYDKIMPLVRRLHGKSNHVGKRPAIGADNVSSEHIEQLKAALAAAVEKQDFELAVKLRDEINSLILKGGNI